jgi:hypothetical protein
MATKTYKLIYFSSANGIRAEIYTTINNDGNKQTKTNIFYKSKLHNNFDATVDIFCKKLEQDGYIRELTDNQKFAKEWFKN